jgi:hypothetical protein
VVVHTEGPDDPDGNPALGRVLRQAGGANAFDLLANRLSGADLTSLSPRPGASPAAAARRSG